MDTRAVIRAPAKLNLSLDITGEDGGYHLLDSVMLSIGLFDILTLSLRTDGKLRVSCAGTGISPDIPENDDNLAAVAARRFFASAGIAPQGLDIYINKRIPSQAGLAGGSADAAAVLVGMNHIFESGLNCGELEEIAAALGSDVPFCIRGGCARASGRGEILRTLSMPPDCIFVIAGPERGMSTRHAFSMYDHRDAEPPRPDTGALVAALENGDFAGVGQGMRNVFEGVCAPGEVGELKSVMLANGASGAAMSGSGTAVAGLFREEEAARRCIGILRGVARYVFPARPSCRGAHVLFAD